MPRPRPPYLHRETNRHGTVVWYVRKEHGPRIRLRAAYGTEEFQAQYLAACRGEAPTGAPQRAQHGTLAWLVDRYRETPAWREKLSPSTRRLRENLFRRILAVSGCEPASSITRKAIVAARDKQGLAVSTRRHMVEAMRGLFQWAAEAELVPADPTVGVKVVRPKTDGHHTWTVEEVAQFEARWPIGTRQRLAFDILLWTGLRRGDVVRLGRQHIRDGLIVLDTEKTGERVTIPVLPPLADSMARTPVDGLTFVPMVKAAFGNAFADWCRAAGVPGRAHGLRKAGATRAANNGATVAQLEALFGWRGGGMASLYTRKADRERLARDGAAKLMENATPSPNQSGAGAKPKKRGRSNVG